MKRLYLLRHAQAESAPPPGSGNGDDHARLLDARGEEQALKLGDYMKAQGIFPDYVLSSSSVRTLQTARLLFGRILDSEGQKVRTHFDRALYLAPADVLLDHIRMTDGGVASLLVVAHNPGIADLCHALAGDDLPLETAAVPPGTLTAFDVAADDWHDLSPGTIRLAAVFAP